MTADSTAPGSGPLPGISALGMRLNATSYADMVERVLDWAARRESRAVSVANVHMVMEAYDNPAFQALVNSCDAVVPDGTPLVWLLRAHGIENASRVYGPNLTLELLRAAGPRGIPVGFYGGSPRALDRLLAFVAREYPQVQVAYACAPPFRPLSVAEQSSVIDDIRQSGARILFVGLGCPKQERWIAEQRGSVPAVMLGVGAAFDFHAGMKPQAPAWMQRIGMEWLFRMITEPRRLFWRYVRHNPRFVVLALRQWWSARKLDRRGAYA